MMIGSQELSWWRILEEMDLNDFNKLCGMRPQEHGLGRARPHVNAGFRSIYKNYYLFDSREIHEAMGLTGRTEFAHAPHMVEVRSADDHVRISGHGDTSFKEVMVFDDGEIIEFHIDMVKNHAVQTVYSANGSIEKLSAPWSLDSDGYMGNYRRFSLVQDHQHEVFDIWAKYEGILAKADEFFTSKKTAFTDLGFKP